MNVIIFGPPLSGKGTQSKKIIADFGLTHLSTGDVLREEKAQKTSLGIKASEYSSKGLLAPDELVAQIVEKFYIKYKSEKGILFDGYPRNTEQVKHLLNVFENNGDKIKHIIFLKVPKDELFKRAIKRAEEEGRADDRDKNIVMNRINEFEDFTIPAINFMKNYGVQSVDIDGNQSIDKIHEIIKSELK